MTITLPDDLEERIELAARARGLDVSAFVRALLEAAAPDSGLRPEALSQREALFAEIDTIRAMTPAVPQTDSATLLRQARDERHDF